MKKILSMAALALTLALNVSAQGKKKTVNNKAKTTKVVKTAVTASLALPANEVLYEEMLPATAKIIVFDSVVVDKDNFIDHIPLGKEAGVFTAYNRHFNTEEPPGASPKLLKTASIYRLFRHKSLRLPRK